MASVKNSFDKYSESSDDAKNKSSNDLLTNIEDYAKSVGAKTKTKFSPIIPNIKIPDSLQGLMDQLGDKMKNWVSNKINDVKRLAEDTLQAAITAGKTFVTNLAKKGIDMLASRLYLPEELYLAKVIVLWGLGQDLRYKNDAVRKVILTKDMPKTLRWINDRLNITYSISNTSYLERDLSDLVKYSCIESIDYILMEIKNEVDYLTTIRNTYDPESEEYSKYDNQIKKGKKIIVKWFKKMLVYSVGNLNLPRLKRFIKDFNLSPSYFGTTDKEWGQAFKINASDIDIIAPFWKNNQFGESFIKNHDLIEDGHLPKYIVPRNVFIKYIYVYLADKGFWNNNQLYNYPLYKRLCYPTMDVFTEALDNALNAFNDLDWDSLWARDEIYKYTMEVKHLLKDPTTVVYAQLVSYGQVLPAPSMDDAGNFVPPPSVSNPSGSVIGGSNSNSGSSSGNNSNSNNGIGNDIIGPNGKPGAGNNMNDENFDKLEETEKIQFMNYLFRYYFKFIEINKHYLILKELFKDLQNGYKTSVDEKKKLAYRKLIESYITPLYLTDEWNEELYFQKIVANTVEEKYTKCMIDIRMNGTLSLYCLNYLKNYKEDAPEIIKEFLDLFIKNYNYLKEFMYDSVLNQYSDLEIFELLVFAHDKFKTNLRSDISWIKQEDKNEVTRSFIEFFPGADSPEFDVRKYLKTMDASQRKAKALAIIKYCDKVLADAKIELSKRKAIHEAILLEFLPAYEYVINSSGSKDIDINDPSINALIRDQLEYDKGNWTLIIDFNNKLVTEGTEFEYSNLDQQYDFWDKYLKLGDEGITKEDVHKL